MTPLETTRKALSGLHSAFRKALLATCATAILGLATIAPGQEVIAPAFTVPHANDVTTSTTPLVLPAAGTQGIRLTATGADAYFVFWPSDTTTVIKTVTDTATALLDPYVWSVPVDSITGIGNGTPVEIRDGTSGLVKARGVLKSASAYGTRGNLTTPLNSTPGAGFVTFVAWYDPEGSGIVEGDEIFYLVPIGVVVQGTEEEGASGAWVGRSVGSLLVEDKPLSTITPPFAQYTGVLRFARPAGTNVTVNMEHLLTQ